MQLNYGVKPMYIYIYSLIFIEYNLLYIIFLGKESTIKSFLSYKWHRFVRIYSEWLCLLYLGSGTHNYSSTTLKIP